MVSPACGQFSACSNGQTPHVSGAEQADTCARAALAHWCHDAHMHASKWLHVSVLHGLLHVPAHFGSAFFFVYPSLSSRRDVCNSSAPNAPLLASCGELKIMSFVR